MLYRAGGGRITRLHGPFVGDHEVEEVCKHLRSQAEPDYLDLITDEPDGDGDGAMGGEDGAGTGDDLYDRAVAVVTRDRKASTSYVQRRLQIGYNRAATLIERMEQEGVVSPANHAGKREVLAGPPPMV
jgi:S-DNA-T family DNA segregation ATPase FtsK/SpoIIIE